MNDDVQGTAPTDVPLSAEQLAKMDAFATAAYRAGDGARRARCAYEGTRSDGVRMRWVGAQARIGESGEVVEIIAPHVMTQEARVLKMYLWCVWVNVALAAIIASMLAYWVTTRGLKPLKSMADKAAEIAPERLSARLDVAHAPAELQSLAALFNDILDRLENGYERGVQFSADLAHELRTPIGVLIGETQVTLAHERSVAEYRHVL